MIDMQREQLISLRIAAALLPPMRQGKPVTASCIQRWIRHGVLVASGEHVRLEAVRLGGRWLTSAEALYRFALAQTPQAGAPAGLPRSVEQRARESTDAARALEERWARRLPSRRSPVRGPPRSATTSV
jgi:hypothetical protein